MKNDINRQAKRGTLKVIPGFSNDRVFQVFDWRLKKKLREPESLIRLRNGKPQGAYEELALKFFQALQAGKFLVGYKGGLTHEEILVSQLMGGHIAWWSVGTTLFRRTISGPSDVEYVLNKIAQQR